MSLGGENRAAYLEAYRPYLMVLARLHWNKRLQRTMDPADLVQQTLLEAHQTPDQFRSKSDGQMRGWLRVCLVHNLLDALKKVTVPGGELPREAQLLDAVEESSSRLELLVAEQSSPSERAAKDEQLVRLAAALEQLPEAQREAVALHKLQGLSLADVAHRMDCTEPAVAGLYRRGIEKLRELLGGPE